MTRRAFASKPSQQGWRIRCYYECVPNAKNPRLMLLSGECPERALGNERDLVGRYFIEHGFVDSGTFLPSKQTSDLRRYFPVLHPHDPLHGTARPVLSLAPETLASEQLLNAALYFYPGYESHPVFDRRSIKSVMEIWEILKGRAVPGDWSNLLKSAFSRPFAVAHAMTRRAFASKPSQQGWRIRCYYECVPNAKNRMVLTQERDAFDRPRGRLIWRLGDQDLDSVHRFHQVFNKALARAGEGELFFPSDAAVWRERTESGKHPMGTTRMHDSPSHGVVDRNCKVHSCANLYIGGSSVFPAAGYANPTLTIVALATRLADHLASISERRSKPCQS